MCVKNSYPTDQEKGVAAVLDQILAFLSPMVLVWLAVLVIFMAVEAATVTLVSVWFCGGALVALIAAGLGAPLWLQVVLFLAVSLVLLALLAASALSGSFSSALPPATSTLPFSLLSFLLPYLIYLIV